MTLNHIALDLAWTRRLDVIRNKTTPKFCKDDNISYLGIAFTLSVDLLFKENYMPFLHKPKHRLTQISRHKLSWSGHLAAFKMHVLP